MNHDSINLHPIETASKDELQSLQLERLQWKDARILELKTLIQLRM